MLITVSHWLSNCWCMLVQLSVQPQLIIAMENCPFMNGFPLNDGDFPYHTIPYHSYTKLPEGTSLLNYVAHHLSTLFARWYHFGSWRRDFRRVAAKLLGLRWFGDGPRSDGRYGPRLKIYTKICGPIGLEIWQKTERQSHVSICLLSFNVSIFSHVQEIDQWILCCCYVILNHRNFKMFDLIIWSWFLSDV